MGDEERIDEDREEVAEDATPETDEEATEQRTDDYDGLARRIDELMDMIRDRFDGVERMLDALGVAAVESEGNVEPDTPDTIGEAAGEAVDELLGIDALDLL